MRDGAKRTDVAYVWPLTLRLPARSPKLVYLDLNHWIALAKSLSGHPDGEADNEVLAACLRALEDRTAVFPISDTIYLEISKIGQYRQRRDLREVIEQVSRYMVVTSRSVVAAHEIEAVLDGDTILAAAELELNRQVIDGPSPDEEPELRELGWDPTGAFEIAAQRAAQELEQVQRFDCDPRWRRGRIRDVIAAREILIEINDRLSKGLVARGATFEVMFPEPEDTRRAFDSMPSFDVAVTLKTSYHRGPKHQWTPNDIHDIDALGSTLPYCDIVVTDKAMASHAKRTGLAECLGTLVLSRLSDLLEHL